MMISSNNGYIYSIRSANNKNDEGTSVGRDFKKKLGMYCQEYCDYTGIHGLKYFGERRSCLER